MAHVEQFTPVLGICRRPCDPLEAGEEPLRKGIDGVSGWLRDNLAATRGSLEAKEVFHRGQVRSLNSFTKIAVSGHNFTGTWEPFLSKLSLHQAEIPSSRPALDLLF
jgi:hypothetical protein